MNYLNLLEKIYNYIKYDGKPPKEVLEKKKKSSWFEKHYESRATIPRGFYSEPEPEPVKTPEQIAQEKLDREEWELDNVIETFHRMKSLCKECGSDILERHATCSATECGYYKKVKRGNPRLIDKVYD